MGGTVADLIRTARERKGWTLEHLATVAALEKSTIYRIERGESIPRGATRRKLADALGLPLDALLSASAAGDTAAMDEHLDQGAAELLRTLRRVWPDLDASQQLDLLQSALNMRQERRKPGGKSSVS